MENNELIKNISDNAKGKIISRAIYVKELKEERMRIIQQNTEDFAYKVVNFVLNQVNDKKEGNININKEDSEVFGNINDNSFYRRNNDMYIRLVYNCYNEKFGFDKSKMPNFENIDLEYLNDILSVFGIKFVQNATTKMVLEGNKYITKPSYFVEITVNERNFERKLI